jgi:hypothetical protein
LKLLVPNPQLHAVPITGNKTLNSRRELKHSVVTVSQPIF